MEHQMKRRPSPEIEKIRAQERAKARIEKEKLQLPERPREERVPELEGELADLSDADLMDELAIHTRWANYLNTQVALAEITESSAESILNNTRNIARAKSSSGGSVTEFKAKADLQEDVLEAEREYISAKSYRKLVATVYENAERNASVVSRELTRRVGREGPERRDRRWNP